MSSEPNVYLITGCSSGLGLDLARVALAAGHKVIATSRNPDKTPEVVSEIKTLGGHWGVLDVTSADLHIQFQALLSTHGRIDVLINNAGFAAAAVVETTDLDLARRLFETNYFGVMRLCQLVIPVMRKQGGGVIMNVSSGSTVKSVPTISAYAASKTALDALTEALRSEVTPFGITVLLAQPGDMRTSFKGNAPRVELPDAYKGTIAEVVLDHLLSMQGKETINPRRVAKRIVEVVDGTGMASSLNTKEVFRVPFGREILEAFQERIEGLSRVLEVYKDMATSVDFNE